VWLDQATARTRREFGRVEIGLREALPATKRIDQDGKRRYERKRVGMMERPLSGCSPGRAEIALRSGLTTSVARMQERILIEKVDLLSEYNHQDLRIVRKGPLSVPGLLKIDPEEAIVAI